MKNYKRQLGEELSAAGAPQAEIDGLVEVAGHLRQLKTAAAHTKQSSSKHHWWHPRRAAAFGLTAIVGILVGASLVAYAQTSLPGSWPYPAKRLSETVAVAFDPNYRATLMMRRSLEVEELVNQHASQRVVLATLADYQTEAAAYKTANYAAFEYCKSNLKQAAATAPSPERSAINSTVSSLQA